ncbi:hypothetical protein UFOVP223_38 [uncultured Caudovirales phage]|uniref:Uncharacterized protein n=1 Tax=uncultured Caudovirales phage TaxID=2100421 RepID=A0A6J5LB26_9CAUD|nr:hypothetical protein UFOVP110_126 [uncultured Caudovirales phage]CAB5219195.1 hypothetical protein UFOVP223_38 [uncultured Caudovirales phage]
MEQQSFKAYVVNIIRVNRHGEKVADETVLYPWGRIEWHASSNHDPQAKDRDARQETWVRICTSAPEASVSGRWEWMPLNPDVRDMYLDNGTWTQWFSWTNSQELKKLIGETDEY